jgi:CHRD domain
MKRVLVPVFLMTVAIVVACSNDESTPQAKVFSNLTMSPANETPPCTDAGVNAVGTATVTVPPDNASVVVNVTYSGLSTPVFMAHIHSGTPAAAGPIVLPFTAPFDSPFTKTLTANDYTPAAGTPADFASFVTALKSGGAGYVNLHTDACRPGEIRAEIQ